MPFSFTEAPIASRQNRRIVGLCKLADRGERERTGLFRFDGVKLLCEAVRREVPLTAVFVRAGSAGRVTERMAELYGLAPDALGCPAYAVEDSLFSAGRRGIAGTVFVHKVAGAAAAAGKSLDEVADVAQKAIDRIRSMGMASEPCTLPGALQPNFQLADDEIEIGMGIHGEPGISKETMMPAQALAKRLLDCIFADKDYTGTETAVLLNGLGGTPLMELYVMYHEVKKELEQRGVTIWKALVGNYMTSLEMAGCSVTLMQLDEELKGYLSAPCNTPALKVL